MRNRPRWRWWLFCASLWLGFRTGWRWAWVGRLYSWSVLPEWVATPEEIGATNEAHDLDCAQCGCGVPCLVWHDPDDENPGGGYLAGQDEEHVCPECGALNQVDVDDGADPPTASLNLLHCRHGRAEDEPCWVCDLKAEISWWRCWLLRALRQLWCASGGHEWTRYNWVPGKTHELCKCGVSREAPNATVGGP